MLAAVPSGSATLVYLDPPFNSGRSYEALLGVSSAGHRRGDAFSDTWLWDDKAEAELKRLPSLVPSEVSEFVRSLIRSLGPCDLSAYLVMLASRLVDCRRVLA